MLFRRNLRANGLTCCQRSRERSRDDVNHALRDAIAAALSLDMLASASSGEDARHCRPACSPAERGLPSFSYVSAKTRALERRPFIQRSTCLPQAIEAAAVPILLHPRRRGQWPYETRPCSLTGALPWSPGRAGCGCQPRPTPSLLRS